MKPSKAAPVLVIGAELLGLIPKKLAIDPSGRFKIQPAVTQ